jgi:PTH2 family peptidyl-tRNA hydrolase
MKQVIVIRKDLKMRRGKEIAQGAHASMAVLTKYVTENKRGWWGFYPPKEMEEWLRASFIKIVVTVNSKLELMEVYSKAAHKGIPCALITDNGATEFHGEKTITCCAIGPHRPEVIDQITGHLKLY